MKSWCGSPLSGAGSPAVTPAVLLVDHHQAEAIELTPPDERVRPHHQVRLISGLARSSGR
jgi:hypothetical protein